MYGRARLLVLVASLIMMPPVASAQVSLQPTARSLVTVENEGWYLAGEPIAFAGNVYYPAGAQVYFDGNEMVRSGFYLGIPLYTRTTEEPYSRVYVPLAGALMQPYERRRAGEVAGTVGSTAPGYPVVIGQGRGSQGAAGTAEIVGTAGAVEQRPSAAQGAAPARRGSRTVLRPKGVNGMFIEFDHARWFNKGPATLLDPARFTRIGDYRGFNVYRDRGGTPDTIYVQLAENVTRLATPYSRRQESGQQAVGSTQ